MGVVDTLADQSSSLLIGEDSGEVKQKAEQPFGCSAPIFFSFSAINYWQEIFLTRVSWRPPSNLVQTNNFTISSAVFSSTNRAGMHRILASLCSQIGRASCRE